MQHLHDVPHEQIVKDYCMMCGVWYEGNVPFRGLNEPVIVLCATCQQVPSAVEWVRAKRRAEFPADKTVKSF